MSINSTEQYQAASSRIFNDYSVSEGSSNSLKEENQIRRTKEGSNDLNDYSSYSFKKPYKIPLNVVRSKVSKLNIEMQELLVTVESLLDRVYINPFLDHDIEECHYNLWDEVKKNNKQLFEHNQDEGMVYAGGSPLFDETTGEYIEQESFKNPEYISFNYEDESQHQAAAFYFSWAKMAENHSRLVTEELSRQADSIPTSEVDNISKKQAAQFQAFFSIRVASYTEAVDNLLFSLKKDLEDTCDVFYKRFVAPSLRFKTKVAAPLELDLLTTSLGTQAPMLSEEVITAVNAFKGNFGSVLTDMVQRRNNIQAKFDKLLSFNIQRKKYISYIDSLAVKASSRPKIVLSNVDDVTSNLFDSIFIDKSKRESLKSSHDNLDDLEKDSHPQYLLRSGGNLFGDISVAEGVTIDGVDLDQHAHTGSDGTVRIKSTDIDYESVRAETVLLESENGNTLQVSIDSYLESIRQGGLPTVDAVVLISIPDEVSDKYEFEIMYVENQ